MSSALLRKSLRLFEDNSDETGRKKYNADERQHKHVEQRGRSKLKAKKRNLKLKGLVNVEEIRKELLLKESYTEENLKRLQALRCGEIDQATANKILRRAVKRSTESPGLQTTEEGTVFTEEDFKKFEQEYID